MNTAIGIWILVVGDLVLPSDGLSGQGAGIEILDLPPVQPYSSPAARAPGSPPAPSPGGQQPSGRGPAPQGTRQQAAPQERPVPFAPTDPQAGAESFPWGPPTANEPMDLFGLRSQPGVGGRSSFSDPRINRLGPYAQPRATRPPNRPYSPTTARKARASQSAPARHAPSAGAVKPFSNYRPAPTLSPWAEMFRVNPSSTVDRYNGIVRPLLNQRSTNRQVGGQIYGLQGTTRRQGAAIQGLGRTTRGLQGAGSPQYYMNYGGYYPGLGR